VSSRRGRPEGEFGYHHRIEVRYRDTDALGHVNNAVYLTYFEAARAGYYQALTGAAFGTDHGADGEPRTFLIAEASVTYRAPAYFGEWLDVGCRVHWVSRSSFGLEYLITAAESSVGPARDIAYGETAQVMFDPRARRPTRMPTDFLELIERYEGRPILPRG